MLDATACYELESFIREHIPLTRTMELGVSAPAADQLQLSAPLGPNINDKGTAFGGSQTALATLTAWGLVWLAARQHRWNIDIVVARSEQQYRRPIDSDLQSICRVPDAATWQDFQEELNQRGRGRIAVEVEVRGRADTESAMNFSGLFVAINNEQKISGNTHHPRSCIHAVRLCFPAAGKKRK